MASKDTLPPEQDFDNSHLYIWVKSLEGKVNNLVREINILKNDFSRKNKQIKEEVKIFNEELLEVKREQESTLRKMDLIIKELKMTAGADEVMTIKKYLDLWSPLHFVTQRDVERIVKLEMEKKTHPMKIVEEHK